MATGRAVIEIHSPKKMLSFHNGQLKGNANKHSGSERNNKAQNGDHDTFACEGADKKFISNPAERTTRNTASSDIPARAAFV